MDKGTCSDPEGCDNPVWATKLCKKHYMERRSVALKQQECKNEQCDSPRGPTQTWAMKHRSSGESPDDYMPLCWPCHAKYDNFAARLPDNVGAKRTPEQRERMRQAALKREARKRDARNGTQVAA
jgi:hypothetical protein